MTLAGWLHSVTTQYTPVAATSKRVEILLKVLLELASRNDITDNDTALF